ncbi:DUF1186 family protein [bacterium]|nr:DUF1186 family protein [bacterium]
MLSDGDLTIDDSGLSDLISELRTLDFSIQPQQLTQILSHDKKLIPHLEDIIREALKESDDSNLTVVQRQSDAYAVVHAFYLLAQLQAEKSLDLVLEFLAQKQTVIDYWLLELVQDDLWEVIFHLGQNRLGKLHEFMTVSANNVFSRLTVATTLVQLALHFDSKRPAIIETFQRVLGLRDEEPDFIGLLVSELLDLCELKLQLPILQALRRNRVWSGIITEDQVRRSMQRRSPRRLRPLGIFERYELLRRNPYLSKVEVVKQPEFFRQLKLQKPL